MSNACSHVNIDENVRLNNNLVGQLIPRVVQINMRVMIAYKAPIYSNPFGINKCEESSMANRRLYLQILLIPVMSEQWKASDCIKQRFDSFKMQPILSWHSGMSHIVVVASVFFSVGHTKRIAQHLLIIHNWDINRTAYTSKILKLIDNFLCFDTQNSLYLSSLLLFSFGFVGKYAGII